MNNIQYQKFKTQHFIIILLFIFTFPSCSNISELYLIKQNNDWGYINKKGKIIIPPSFEACCYHRQEDTCCSRIIYPNNIGIIKKDGLYGAINAKGEFTIPPTFEYLDQYHNSYIIAKSENKFGILDIDGDTLFPFIFDDQLINCNSAFGSGTINDTIYLLNFKTGTKVKTQFNKVKYFTEGFAGVKQSEYFGFIDQKGNLKIDTVFQDVWPFRKGLAAVQQYYLWGFIDTLGNFIIEPKYESTQGFDAFTGEHAIVSKNGKYGVIDRNENIKIPFHYEYLFFESKNKLFATIKTKTGSNKSGIINLKEKWIYTTTDVNFEYCKGIIKTSSGSKFGLKKMKSGRTILPEIFSDIAFRNKGLTMFVCFDDSKNKELFGYINNRGKIIWVEEGFDFDLIKKK